MFKFRNTSVPEGNTTIPQLKNVSARQNLLIGLDQLVPLVKQDSGIVIQRIVNTVLKILSTNPIRGNVYLAQLDLCMMLQMETVRGRLQLAVIPHWFTINPKTNVNAQLIFHSLMESDASNAIFLIIGMLIQRNVNPAQMATITTLKQNSARNVKKDMYMMSMQELVSGMVG